MLFESRKTCACPHVPVCSTFSRALPRHTPLFVCTSLSFCSSSQFLRAHPPFPLSDHSRRINGKTLIQSGPRGGMTRGDPHRAGFQHLARTVMPSPLTGQQQHYTVLESVVHTAPTSAIASSQDTHCSGKDAYTQTHSFSLDPLSLLTPAPPPMTLPLELSWSALSCRRICSKKRPRAPDHRPFADGLQRTPTHAHHLSNWIDGTCLLCCVPLVLRVRLCIPPSWSECPTSSASIPPHPLESPRACLNDAPGGNSECVLSPSLSRA